MARPKKNAAQAQDALPTLDTVPGIPVEEQPYPLPEGWKWVRLGDCNCYTGEIVNPHNFPKETFELYSVPSSAVNYPEIISGIDIGSSKQAVEQGDVLLCKINPRINRVWYVTGYTNNKLLASSEWIIFRNKHISSKYMMFCMKAAYFREFMLSNVSGVGGSLMRAQPKHVRRYPIPLPPLEVQQRIVERIESLFAKLDEAREKAESALESFERRKAAILHKAFTGELTAHSHVSSKWKDKSAEELFTYVTSGSRGWAKYYAERGSIFIRMGNLSHKSIELDFSNIQHVLLPHRTEGQRTRLQKNDILISITADIGMVGLFRDDTAEAYINQHIALARPSTNENAEFIAWYLISDVGLAQLKKKQRGTTKVGLGLDDIRSIHLKMPSLPEQQEIVRILDRIFAREQQAREAAENVLQRIDQMKKAILARAFRGELD